MAIYFFSSLTIAPPRLDLEPRPKASSFSFQFNEKYNISSSTPLKRRSKNIVVFCASSTDDNDNNDAKRRSKLEVGSPVVFVEAPKIIKTDTAISCLKVNSGIVKPGDVGRIVSRKPMDVWAIRISIGTYLIDGKYFRPLELDK